MLKTLNPLQRRDYPTECQLLWTLGLTQPNKDDDMVRTNLKKYSKVQSIGIIANGNDGSTTLAGYHHKYVEAMIAIFHDIYYTGSTYFYNVASEDRKTWRELSGIRVQDSDIGYVIHDANNPHPASSERLSNLAQTLSEELVEFDFLKRTFNTPALLGEMGAGTALTNVALGIAYANHIAKHVLVAGTTDPTQPTALLVIPPEKVRSEGTVVPCARWEHHLLGWVCVTMLNRDRKVVRGEIGSLTCFA